VSGATRTISKPRVLDIGCAFGTFLSHLDPAWDLYGIDLSDHAVSKARENLPHAHIVRSSAMDIPFQESFDVITAFDVIEHLPDLDRTAVLISSKLAVNGSFIFVVPVYDGPLGPVVRALDHDPTHIHKASRDFWLAWAQRHFGVEDWRGILRYLMPWGTYIHWPTRVARHWTPAIVVSARRK
jgi:SAM-dependent methyltransferase